MSTGPEMVYFPIGGRGELTRLIAAVGGVDLTESFPGPDWKEKIDPSFFGSLPILKHGDLALAQSLAIASYVSAISPKFSDLTPAQRAVDDMLAATLEDIIAGCAATIFERNGKTHATASTDVPEVLNKYLGPVEEMLPATGFMNGLAFPTGADLAIFCMAEMTMPVGAAKELAGGFDMSQFPKITALVAKTKADSTVAKYLASATTLKAKM